MPFVLQVNLQYRPVRREERDVHSSSLLIDVYAFSDVSLRRQASNDQAEKTSLFAQERC